MSLAPPSSPARRRAPSILVEERAAWAKPPQAVLHATAAQKSRAEWNDRALRVGTHLRDGSLLLASVALFLLASRWEQDRLRSSLRTYTARH